MLDLSNKKLRARDIRKLVEPSICNISWDSGSTSESEWVSLGKETTTNWLVSKNIEASELTCCTNAYWSENKMVSWEMLQNNLDSLVQSGFTLFVSNNRIWLLEVNPIGVARFGFWR